MSVVTTRSAWSLPISIASPPGVPIAMRFEVSRAAASASLPFNELIALPRRAARRSAWAWACWFVRIVGLSLRSMRFSAFANSTLLARRNLIAPSTKTASAGKKVTDGSIWVVVPRKAAIERPIRDRPVILGSDIGIPSKIGISVTEDVCQRDASSGHRGPLSRIPGERPDFPEGDCFRRSGREERKKSAGALPVPRRGSAFQVMSVRRPPPAPESGRSDR